MNKIQRITPIHEISPAKRDKFVNEFACQGKQILTTNTFTKLFSAGKAPQTVSNLVMALVLLLSVIGCSHVGNYLDAAKDKGISTGYIDVLNRWTRKETVYSQFETKVHISATYKSDDFNRAYGAEYARIYYLTDPEKKRMEDMQSGFTHESREFFFYAAMAKKDTNDFDRPDSIWTIFLIDEQGNQIKPLDLRRIERITPLMEEFYPYINKYYGNCYSLKFPLLAADGKNAANAKRPMKVVFSSVLGKAELSWP